MKTKILREDLWPELYVIELERKITIGFYFLSWR